MSITSRIHVPRVVRNPSLRLFVFHHAGGSSQSYVSWHRYLPEDWELCLVDYPGRGVNADVPIAEHMDELASFVTDGVTQLADVSFVFHGHSAGALVAYATTRRLRELDAPMPQWLGVSASKAPSYSHVDLERKLLSLTDDELLMELARFGGAPKDLTLSPEMRAHFLELLRADVGAVLATDYVPLSRPLDIPINCYGGTQDTFAPSELLDGWRHETGHAIFSKQILEGDHFFIFSAQRFFLTQLVRDVSAVTSAVFA